MKLLERARTQAAQDAEQEAKQNAEFRTSCLEAARSAMSESLANALSDESDFDVSGVVIDCQMDQQEAVAHATIDGVRLRLVWDPESPDVLEAVVPCSECQAQVWSPIRNLAELARKMDGTCMAWCPTCAGKKGIKLSGTNRNGSREAFARTMAIYPHGEQADAGAEGLSKRELFALHLMAALVTGSHVTEFTEPANAAAAAADALLARLEQRT